MNPGNEQKFRIETISNPKDNYEDKKNKTKNTR